MHYIRVISKKMVTYLCHYDPEKDSVFVDQLIDKGYRIEKTDYSDKSNHISIMFSESIRQGLQGLL